MKYNVKDITWNKDAKSIKFKVNGNIISSLDPHGSWSTIDDDAFESITWLLKRLGIGFKREDTNLGPNILISTSNLKKFLTLLVKVQKSKNEDLIPGGKGDDKPDSLFDSRELAIGVEVEKEHVGQDIAKAKEIAKDHLTENPHYYSELIRAGLVDEPKAVLLYKKHFK